MSTPSRRRPGGGRGGAEPGPRIREREAQAWDLAVRGYSQRAISQHLGVSQPAVCKILQRVGDRLEQERIAHTARTRARREAQLQYLLREALEGWQRSQRDHVRRRQRRAGGPAEPSAGPPTSGISDVTVETRAGDPRFLREAKDLVLGSARLDPPGDARAPQAPVDLGRLTDDELEQLDVLLGRARREEASPTPVTAGPPARRRGGAA